MKWFVLMIGISGLALGGCSSTSSENGGSIGEAVGVSVAAATDADGNVISADFVQPVTATYDSSTEGQVAVTFSGGALDGRTLVFADDDTGAVISGLDGTEEDGFLRTVEGDYALAAFVDIIDSDGGGKFVAAHTGEPATDIPSSGTLSYSGRLGGVAAGTETGEAMGDIAISANFNDGTVDGTVSGISIAGDNGSMGTLGDVGFEATMSSDRATYSGSNMTIGGVAAVDGGVEGGFYGPEAAETAGGLAAFGAGGEGLVGAYAASRD